MRTTMSRTRSFQPHVFWLFGLSGAGKTTLATGLRAFFADRGAASLALDGDAVRAGLCAGLGFSAADRTENLRRSAEVAKLAIQSGLTVVASFITPLEIQRQLVRDIIGSDRVSFVFLDAPLEVCRGRDVKGLYRRAAEGLVPQMTGLDSRFERPPAADLLVDTVNLNAAASAEILHEFARGRLFP